MAFETGVAIVCIATYFVVLSICVRLVVLMTIDATERGIIPCRGVAIGALGPLTGMFSRVNREKHIVVRHFCWSPAWIGRMTTDTIGRQIQGLVIWICRSLEIRQMTIHTFGSNAVEGFPLLMTGKTILQVVAKCERKEIMIDPLPCPFIGIHRVTFETIGRKTASSMIGLFCHLKISLVTIETIDSQRIKTQ